MIAGMVFIALAAVLAYRTLATLPVTGESALVRPKALSPRLQQLLGYADRLYREKKAHAAEKAYLEVLKHDHKNILAYARLGSIYAGQGNYPDAIECFQLAARFRPEAAAFYNLGLAYFENKNYMKAVAAFEKSIMFKPSAARYIGLAKAYQRVANPAKMIDALEHAAGLEPTQRHLTLLAEAYAKQQRPDDARATYARLVELYPGDTRGREALEALPASLA